MNKYIKMLAIPAILMSFVLMAPYFASAEITNGDDDIVNTDSSGSIVDNGGDDVVDTTSSESIVNNGDDDVSNTASVINSLGNSEVLQIVDNGGDDVDQPAVVTPPVVLESPAITNNNEQATLRVQTGGGGSFVSSPIVVSLPIATTSCSSINTYLRYGVANVSSEVIKLQTFLRNNEKLNVDINGNFDVKTFEAVKSFQNKYKSEIMDPWGIKAPTGNVYYTTKNKINNILCKTDTNLTQSEITAIASYKISNQNTVNKPVNTSIIKATSTNVNNNVIVPEQSKEEPKDTIENIGLNKNDSQLANVANADSTNKIWKFVKWLFGY